MQPLALVCYQKLIPGSTLVNRMRDLKYRVHALNDLREIQPLAASEGPMLLLLDASGDPALLAGTIQALKAGEKTSHIPVLAFADDDAHQSAARQAGATLVVNEAAITSHLEQLLEQVLHVD